MEKKIQDKFNVPKTFQLKPIQVSTQVVAGQNYFFKVLKTCYFILIIFRIEIRSNYLKKNMQQLGFIMFHGKKIHMEKKDK